MAHLHLLTPLLVLTLISSTTHVSLARPSSQPTNPAQDFLSGHNQARAAVRVKPLKWSQVLANASARVVHRQRVRGNCNFANLSSDVTKYGANQLWARGMVVSPKMVVESWVGEKKFYNYRDDSCVANHQCGVYKQVVWRKSSELGCAQASCVKDGSTLTVCFYNPPGNVFGEKPY